MNLGIVVLVVLGVVTLSQLFVQGMERRKEHRQLVDRLDELLSTDGRET